MELTAQLLKEKARSLGIDCIGIGSVDRYRDAPAMFSPLSLYPDCRTVITIGMRIPRGSYRGILEGTHWHNYTFYSYNRLNTIFRPRLTYALTCFIEDFGWEAMPHYPGGPEVSGRPEPLAPGKLPPEVCLSARIMAAGTGMGEIGHSKVFLTPEFGPRVRIGMILTDAELESDPVLPTGTICNECGRCVTDCPGNAIPHTHEKDKPDVAIRIGSDQLHWGDVDMGRCTLTHHGLNNRISPFLKKDLPNFEFDVTKAEMTEEEAYMLTHVIAGGVWGRKFDAPDDGLIHYYRYIRGHVGYFALCGARGCICACMDSLEKRKAIRNLFKNPLFKRKLWILPVKKDKLVGRLNLSRETYLDKRYPGLRDREY
jgi:ferredoxin